MKKRILSLILLVLLAVSFIPASADDFFGKEYKVVKCNEFITLREEPSTKAGALDRVRIK